MSDPDFNLLVALDVLLSEASVAGAARRLNLSTSAMSRTLSRLRDVRRPDLVRAGRNMVLTPWAEATRDRAGRAVHDAGRYYSPQLKRSARKIWRVFLHQGKRWFCGGVWACAYSSGCRRSAGRLCASRLSRKKRHAIFGKGWLIWRLFRVIWGQKYGCNDCLRIGLLASSVRAPAG